MNDGEDNHHVVIMEDAPNEFGRINEDGLKWIEKNLNGDYKIIDGHIKDVKKKIDKFILLNFIRSSLYGLTFFDVR